MKLMQKPHHPLMPHDELNRLRDIALGLLARREHTCLELRHKLQQRGFSREQIAPVLDALIADDYLSDQRFAEVYAASRADKGYGPLRIERELRERGLERDLIQPVLQELAADWPSRLARLQQKRFGDLPADYSEQTRQMRFLRQRGYPLDQIRKLFKSVSNQL